MAATSVTSLAKRLFLRAGIYDLIRLTRPNRKAALLRYHAVVEPQHNSYTYDAIALSPGEFEAQVRHIARRYRILSLDAVVEALRGGGKSLPANAVVFTFDDGYRDNFQAAEILNRYGATGTFYLTTEPIGRRERFWLSEVYLLTHKSPSRELHIALNGKAYRFPLQDSATRFHAANEIIRLIKSHNRTVRETIRQQVLEQLGKTELLQEVEAIMLDWEQVREMDRWGMVIGSHTLTHLNLPNADPEDAREEITRSRKVLEEQLGHPIRHFSYPNSGPYEYYNKRIRGYVVEAGYHSAATSCPGFVDHHSDLFALRRVRTVPPLEEVIHALEWDRVFGR